MATASSVASFDAWNNLQPAVMTMIMFWFLVGAMIRSLPLSLQGVLPYTVLVLLAGLLFGALATNCQNSLGDTFGTLTLAAPDPGISPAMLQLSVLPPLIFADMFTADVKLFIRTLGQTLLLAFPGVLMSAFLIAICMVYLDPDHFTWPIAMMFGAMVSATDPVAVLVSMKELGCDQRLVTIVSGESVLNDGCAVVIFMMLYGVVFKGMTVSTGQIAKFACLQTFGAVALSLAFLSITLLILRVCRKDVPVVVTVLVSMPFLCFYASMLLNTSGILAVVAFGLGLNWFGRGQLEATLLHESQSIWEFIEFIANTFVFAISGAIIAADLMTSPLTPKDLKDLGMIMIVYVCSQVVRGIAILVFYPFLKCTGPPFSWKDAVFTWWGGLKGAVGLSIAMIFRMSIPKGDPLAPTGQKFMIYMGGVYLLTSLINATTAGCLVKALSLNARGSSNEPLLKSIGCTHE